MRELSSAPQGHLFELLVLPGAERRGNQEFAAQLAHSRSEAEGGTTKSSARPPEPGMTKGTGTGGSAAALVRPRRSASTRWLTPPENVPCRSSCGHRLRETRSNG